MVPVAEFLARIYVDFEGYDVVVAYHVLHTRVDGEDGLKLLCFPGASLEYNPAFRAIRMFASFEVHPSFLRDSACAWLPRWRRLRRVGDFKVRHDV